VIGNGDHVVLLLPAIIGCIRHDFAKNLCENGQDQVYVGRILQVMGLADLQVEISQLYFTEGMATQLLS